MSAKSNIAKLPEWCYHVSNTTGELIRVKSGERGFYNCDQGLPVIRCNQEGITMSELADRWNAAMGITKAHREAMDWGSMFGWHLSLADPDNEDYRDL